MISFFVWTGLRTPINFHKHYLHKGAAILEVHSITKYIWSNETMPGGLFVNGCRSFMQMCVPFMSSTTPKMSRSTKIVLRLFSH